MFLFLEGEDNGQTVRRTRRKLERPALPAMPCATQTSSYPCKFGKKQLTVAARGAARWNPALLCEKATCGFRKTANMF